MSVSTPHYDQEHYDAVEHAIAPVRGQPAAKIHEAFRVHGRREEERARQSHPMPVVPPPLDHRRLEPDEEGQRRLASTHLH